MPQVQGYLIIEKKNGTDGKPHPVDRTLKLGRGQTCDVRVHIESVSDEHCVIIVEPGRPVSIRNLSGSSPTLLNNVSIGNKKCDLQHGDYISVGARRFRWEYLDTSPFYRLALGTMRRKSDADAIHRRTSQPVAVVLPMVHSRRTIEPSIISQVKRNFARYSAGCVSRLSVPSEALPAEKISSKTTEVLEKTLQIVDEVRHVEGRNSQNICQASGSSLFKTPRKAAEAKADSRQSLRSSVTPQAKHPASASKQTSRSTSPKKPVAIKASKRKLSITPVPAKKLKIESPKSLDKRKVAALLGIHGKSAAFRTSANKASTLKQSVKKEANSGQRSTQKARRPLFSEILKKAVTRANAPAKTPGKTRKPSVPTKKTYFGGVAKKKAVQKEQLSALSEVLPMFRVNTTGHANSPETFFVGRKLSTVAAQGRTYPEVSRSPADWVKSARKSAAVSGAPKQATPKRKGPLRTSKIVELPSTRSPSAKSPIPVSTPNHSPGRRTSRVSLANPLKTKTPLRPSLARSPRPTTTKSPAESRKSATPKPTTPKSATPKAISPKLATPKSTSPKASLTAATPRTASPKTRSPKPSPKSLRRAAKTPQSKALKSLKRISLPIPLKSKTPKMMKRASLSQSPKLTTPKSSQRKSRVATPKAATPKRTTPKAATPKPPTPKAATPKPATPKAATPKPPTPKAATPKPATPKAATPKPTTPKAATPKPTTPKAATPKPTTPKAATPKPTTPKAATPKPATPKTTSPKAATPKSTTPKAATPKPTTPKAATPKPTTPKAATPKPTTPKAATPKPTTPKAATPKPTTPKAATPKPTTPKAATPKPTTPKAATPKPTTPKAATPKPASPKADTPKPATPKAATPKAESPNRSLSNSPQRTSILATFTPGSSKSPERSQPGGYLNPVLEAMRKASLAGSPVRLNRISLPSTSTTASPSPNVATQGSSTAYATPVKRARSISPEKSLTSILKDSTRTLLSVTPSSLVQSLRGRMPKITTDEASFNLLNSSRSKGGSPASLSKTPNQTTRYSTAKTVSLNVSPKSPLNLPAASGSSENLGRGALVTSTPAPGHRSSILIRGSSGPFTTGSPHKTDARSGKSPDSKNLSVTFSDVLVTPGFSPSSSKLQAQTTTPENEITSFDFSAVKTPNVPREMYVSSILSSPSKSTSVTSAKASGSAKRKSRLSGSRDTLTALCSDRRAVRSLASPGGYVDVKGIKRLTTAPIKSPTYLAVEGVKRLFGEAKAHASDSYSSISGVRELFASPSPVRSRTPEKSSSARRESVTSSPVAKIQAQVEDRNWNAPTMVASPSRVQTPAVSSPLPKPQLKNKSPVLQESPIQGSPTKMSAVGSRTKIMVPEDDKPKTKRPGPKSKTVEKSQTKAEPEAPPKEVQSKTRGTASKSKPHSPSQVTPEKISLTSQPGKPRELKGVTFDLPEDTSSPIAQRSTRGKAAPKTKVEEQPTRSSPPSKRGRPAASTKRDSDSSPEPKRTRKAKTSPVTKRLREESHEEKVASPVAKRSRTIRKTAVEEQPASPVAKRGRTTRKEESAAREEKPASPVAKRGRSSRNEGSAGPGDTGTSPVARRGRRKNAVVVEEDVPMSRRATDKKAKVASPVTEKSFPAPKRATRGKAAAKVTSPVGTKRQSKSPIGKRTTRAKAASSATSPKVASPAKRTTKAKVASPAKSPKVASPAKRTTKAKVASPAKSPKVASPAKRMTKAKAASSATSSKVASPAKRTTKAKVASPAKSPKVASPMNRTTKAKAASSATSPKVASSAKRTTKAKVASPAKSPKVASPVKRTTKAKAASSATSPNVASPAKRTTRAKGGKRGEAKAASPAKPPKVVSPAKRTTRAKDKPAKTRSPKLSPRKTRQRK